MKAITREEKIMSGENLTPITRKEMFLAKASGQNIQTPTPITREEYFLSKITGGGGTSNKPTAYTVSSVDELPSNAVDGSLAIVENNGLLGAWKLREYYDPADIVYGTFYFEFYQNLLDEDESLYGNRYDAIEVKNIGYPYISFLSEGERLADGIYDDGVTPPYNYITILKEPTDTNTINFINTCLVRIGSGKGIYTRENGKWVYKCEVV